jgi:hypothetical protein
MPFEVPLVQQLTLTGVVILTKDARIGKNRIERLAVADASVRMLALLDLCMIKIDRE